MASRLETLAAEAMNPPPKKRVKLADRPIASVFRDDDSEESREIEPGARSFSARPGAGGDA